jgi:hypothetical protein
MATKRPSAGDAPVIAKSPLPQLQRITGHAGRENFFNETIDMNKLAPESLNALEWLRLSPHSPDNVIFGRADGATYIND